MHVLIETMDPVYDNRYTVRFDFDLENLEQLENVERKTSENGNDTEGNGNDSNITTVDSERSNESSNSLTLWLIAGISLLILVGIFGYFIVKDKKKENKE